MSYDWLTLPHLQVHTLPLALGWNGPCLQTNCVATLVLEICKEKICWHAYWFGGWLVDVWLLCG
jgi:hypothetical protein